MVAAEAKRRGTTLQLELSSCQVETTSGVAASSAELGAELALLRRTAAQAAEASGVHLLALGLPRTAPTARGAAERAPRASWSEAGQGSGTT